MTHPTYAVHDGIFNGPSGLIGTGDYWGSDDGSLPRAGAVRDGLFNGALGATPRDKARRFHQRGKLRNMQTLMLAPWAISDGVPNPFAPQVELYPTFEHGPDYSRPEFHFPKVARNLDVLSGLGDGGTPGSTPGSMASQIAQGVAIAAGLGAVVGAASAAVGYKSSGRGMAALKGAGVGAAVSGTFALGLMMLLPV